MSDELADGASAPVEETWTQRDYDNWLIQMRDFAAEWTGSDLHHYTTIAGLQGILDSGRLWGTHVAFLNDSQELDYGVGEICNMVEAFASEWVWAAEQPDSTDADHQKFVSELIMATHKFITNNREILKPNLGPFVSCLSTSQDQLSQWRGYGQSGGFAIRFDAKLLDETIQHVDQEGNVRKGPRPALVKVHYIPSDFYERVKTLVLDHITEFANTIRMDDERAQDETQITIRYQLLKNLMEIAPQLKHHKFGEEQEWRIITQGGEDFYTPTKLGLVPRVLVSFDTRAIKEIMVGPGEFADIRKMSIERYLEKNAGRYGGTPVTLSEVPYREL
ncbi:DUF2971 domain-containing protein [Mycobacterium paraintracellulare]